MIIFDKRDGCIRDCGLCDDRRDICWRGLRVSRCQRGWEASRRVNDPGLMIRPEIVKGLSRLLGIRRTR